MHSCNIFEHDINIIRFYRFEFLHLEQLLHSFTHLWSYIPKNIDHNPDDNSIHSKDQYCNKVFSNLRQFRNWVESKLNFHFTIPNLLKLT